MMKKDFADKQKKKLIAQRNQILDTLAGQSDQIKTLLDSLGSQDAQRLTLIENALDRIQQGKYGLCIKCGNPIPEARLEAIPYASLCIACKESEERRNR